MSTLYRAHHHQIYPQGFKTLFALYRPAAPSDRRPSLAASLATVLDALDVDTLTEISTTNDHLRIRCLVVSEPVRSSPLCSLPLSSCLHVPSSPADLPHQLQQFIQQGICVNTSFTTGTVDGTLDCMHYWLVGES